MMQSSGGSVFNQAVFAGFMVMTGVTCVYLFFFG